MPVERIRFTTRSFERGIGGTESRLRVGAVSFLNTKPLIYPILNEEIYTDFELSIDVPSRPRVAFKQRCH